MKLGYIIGFIVIFLLLSLGVSGAAVVALGGKTGDPGSVGNPDPFQATEDTQEAIAKKAEDTANQTQGKTSGVAIDDYKARLKAFGLSAECTSCSAFSAFVMLDSGADPQYPKTTADEQFQKLATSPNYVVYTIDPELRSACNNKPVDIPKRGDLVFARKQWRDDEGELNVRGYGHAGIYLRFTNNHHTIASASLHGRSPKIKTYSEIASFIDCGARLIAPITPATRI